VGNTGATGPASPGILGGSIGGSILFDLGGFNMSVNQQTTPTPLIQAGALSHFTVHFAAPVSTNTVLTVQKNGTNTEVACTVPKGANTCSDATHTAVFVASDTVLVHASYSGLNSATNPSWIATYP